MGDNDDEPMDIGPLFGPKLKYTVPRNNPTDRACWTSQHDQEHLRREKEDEAIDALESRIEKQRDRVSKEKKKLKRLECDRDDEIERINSRRNACDQRIEVKTRLKRSGSRIQNRKTMEYLEKKHPGMELEDIIELLKKKAI
ncbi:hypothetical protein L3Y34_009339 [Caenorhabditis briggsae]|uniref:Uncharacterized protein n=1 Tax=Caenorhabditis briggsae TaxID=6238 RepID=A0AAE9A565_CAEBR|nr:hypothetical protein L3Y34_009339 [Caenorhabditis briggsae]